MSWFQSSNLTAFAKTALKEAQKTIDKALEISEEGSSTITPSTTGVAAAAEAASDFFSSWGVQVGSKKSSAKTESVDERVTPVPALPPSAPSSLSNESKVNELESSNSNGTSRSRSLNHKRSASLEMTEASILPPTPMHKSLTREIPVTLVAAPKCPDPLKDVTDHPSCPEILNLSEPQEKGGSTSQPQHNHTRSLSDTVFNSPNFLDDFNGSLQVLDAETIENQSQHHPTIKSNTIPAPVQSPNLQNLEKIPAGGVPLSKTEEISSVEDSFLEAKVQTVPMTGSITNISNLDLLSTVDLGALPLKTPESDSFSPSTFPIQENQPTETSENTEEERNVGGRSNNEEGFCDNTWNWPDSSDPLSSLNQPTPQQDRKGHTDTDLTETEGLGSTNSESHKNQPDLLNTLLVPKCDDFSSSTTGDSGIGMESSAAGAGSTEKTCDKIETKLEGSKGTITEETLTCPLIPTETNWRSCSRSPSRSPSSRSPSRSPQPSEEVNWVVKASTSPPPAESPRSVTSPVNPLSVSRRESPNPLDLLCNPKGGASSSDHNIMQGMSTPFGQQQHAESSRSSSIVVISSGRNSTPSGSAASTGSSASEGHQEEVEDSHVSSASSYERVDIPSHSNDPELISNRTEDVPSIDFVKVKGKKSQSSSASSSSDIEVIPSNFSSPGGDRKKLTEERYQQTSPIPYQEMESQTEEALPVIDEGKGLSVEISGLLREKDDMIETLREEGDKLSKKQFEVGQVVKKLRVKEKEMELSIKILKGELAGKSLENERLMKSYVSKEGLQQVQNETISKLTVEKRALDLKIEEMKSELEDANANSARMKASVEEASVEILELKNAILSFQREGNEMDSLIRTKTELMSRNDGLQKEVDNLRLKINSNQSTGSSRETELQNQISVLRGKVHSLENQLADNSEILADATMPLSLEIEKLQAQLKTSFQDHEKRESALQSLVFDLELKVKNGHEREKSYKDLNLSLQTNVSNLESRVQELETENKRIVKNLCSSEETERKEVQDRNIKLIRLEGQVAKLTEEVERLNEENHSLGLELKSEKSLVEFGEEEESKSFGSIVIHDDEPKPIESKSCHREELCLHFK